MVSHIQLYALVAAYILDCGEELEAVKEDGGFFNGECTFVGLLLFACWRILYERDNLSRKDFFGEAFTTNVGLGGDDIYWRGRRVWEEGEEGEEWGEGMI